MSQPHPSRSGDSYRCEPPASFPEPNVPGGYGAGRQVDMIDYSMYTPSQQPGYPQPLSPHPPPFPVLPTHPIDGHASVVPRCTGPIPPQPGTGYVNNNARPPPYTFPSAPHAQAPDPTRLPPYRFGNFATPGRPAVPEPEPHPVPSHSGGPSYSYIDEFVSSQGPYPQVRNPPVWPSPTPAQLQPLYNVGRKYRAHRSNAPVAQPHTPQRKALLVGINYLTHPDSRFRLNWGVPDAHAIARFLPERLGFHQDDMRILTDDQRVNIPTKANILAGMRWLVEGAQPGDSLFFFFSGHATQAQDTNGDESDRLDECICATDYMGDVQFLPSYATPGIIVDDDIHDIMVKPLPRGCRLTAVLDCCHSGTLMDLPFIYNSRGVLEPYDPNVAQQKSSPADVISLSACMDNERAFEAREGGALRKAFIEHMTSSGNGGTYLDITRSLRNYMKTKRLKQRPQLSSSHPIDINQLFII